MRRRSASLFLLLTGAALVWACGKSELPDLAIGVIAELSGDIPAVGASCKNAAEMAVAEINDAGGVKVAGTSYRLRLVLEDSKGEAAEAGDDLKRLASEDKVLAIVGPNASVGAIPAAQAAEDGKIPMITPWSTNPLTTAGKKWVFRTCFTDAFEGHVLARFATGYLHAAKAAVLYDPDSQAPKSQAELFRKDFEEAGGKVVAFETYKTGDKDFAAPFGRIAAAAPDLIFLPSYYNEVPLQLKQAHKLGIKVPFLGSDNWSSPELVKLAGADAEGAAFCNHYAPEVRVDAVARFVTPYKNKYGQTPDDVAALTYDSFKLLAKALAGASRLDRDAIREALSKIREFEGVTGKMTFKEGSGDPVKSAVMMRVEDGKPVFLTTVDP
ncbi:MAG TPA: ABC transporter substrate-binding protein [Thermoanaerobaculia bacterium]|jgi:branched-chain amino acid transport system substrate-binding protein